MSTPPLGLHLHGNTQGLAMIACAGTDINATTSFLSMTVDNPVSGSVADQFNAFNDGSPYAGFPTAGFWTATFPASTTVPEPSTCDDGPRLTGLGFAGYRASRKTSAVAA
jgi:hypothetical protein